MDKNCDIIRDLMPACIENTASEASQQAVMTHISTCEECRKIYEDRPEDIVPCQRCAKCHVPYEKGPWIFVCSGNPKMGLANRLDHMISPPAYRKKVAVVGGGIAGMEAALTAIQRGHQVVLYEKTGALGGQLRLRLRAGAGWALAAGRALAGHAGALRAAAGLGGAHCGGGLRHSEAGPPI